MSNMEAYDAGGFPEVDFEFEVSPEDWGELGDLGDVFTLEVDGEEIALPTREQERAMMTAEVMDHALSGVRQEIMDEYGLPEKLVSMLDAPDEDSLRELGAEVARRMGYRSQVAHPGEAPGKYASLPGEGALQKAQSLARSGQGAGPYFALKEAASLHAAGRSGTALTEAQAARVRQALEFAVQAGDVDAATALRRQLGGR